MAVLARQHGAKPAMCTGAIRAWRRVSGRRRALRFVGGERALGSGAVGFLKETRYYPTKDVQAYIENPLDIQSERLSEASIKTEKIFLGLRSIVGVSENILSKQELKNAQLLVDENKLTYEEGSFYNEDYLLSDELALFIQQ